jgi:hypothetical protein
MSTIPIPGSSGTCWYDRNDGAMIPAHAGLEIVMALMFLLAEYSY